LTRARDLAESQYRALANKVEEAKIAVQESANVVQVASKATVPSQPVSPGKLLNTLMGGGIGLMVGVLAMVLWEWWRGPGPELVPAMVGATLKEEESAGHPAEVSVPVD
jgi:uncharacterized protein involved in exopolysaccharide biosynthesis